MNAWPLAWFVVPAVAVSAGFAAVDAIASSEPPGHALLVDNPKYDADALHAMTLDEAIPPAAPQPTEEYAQVRKGQDAVCIRGPDLQPPAGTSVDDLYKMEDPFFTLLNPGDPRCNCADGLLVKVNDRLSYTFAGDDFENEVDVARVTLWKDDGVIRSELLLVGTGDGVAHQVSAGVLVDGASRGSTDPVSVESRESFQESGNVAMQVVDSVPGFWWALGAGSVGLVTQTTVRTWRKSPIPIPPIVPLYSRVQRDDALDQPNRAAIQQAIEAEPGIHGQELQRRLGVSQGALDHHLRKLVDVGLVTAIQGGRYTCYFAKDGADRVTMAAAPLFKAPQARAVLDHILQNPDCSAGSVAQATGLTQGGATYHVQRLVAGGLVASQRKGSRVALNATPSGAMVGRRFAK